MPKEFQDIGDFRYKWSVNKGGVWTRYQRDFRLVRLNIKDFGFTGDSITLEKFVATLRKNGLDIPKCSGGSLGNRIFELIPSPGARDFIRFVVEEEWKPRNFYEYYKFYCRQVLEKISSSSLNFKPTMYCHTNLDFIVVRKEYTESSSQSDQLV